MLLKETSSLAHPFNVWIKRYLLNTGYFSKTESYVVGGFVRDRLTGTKSTSKDIDIVTIGKLDINLIKECFGTENVAVFEKFGTAQINIQTEEGLMYVEFTTARKEVYTKNSRKPLCEPAGLEEDLLRRDFNINAIAWDLVNDKLLSIGPLPTFDHIDTCDDPKVTFSEDPLRLLRLIRFILKTGLPLSSRIQEYLKTPECNALTANLTPTRIFWELHSWCEAIVPYSLEKRASLELRLAALNITEWACFRGIVKRFLLTEFNYEVTDDDVTVYSILDYLDINNLTKLGFSKTTLNRYSLVLSFEKTTVPLEKAEALIRLSDNNLNITFLNILGYVPAQVRSYAVNKQTSNIEVVSIYIDCISEIFGKEINYHKSMIKKCMVILAMGYPIKEVKDLLKSIVVKDLV